MKTARTPFRAAALTALCLAGCGGLERKPGMDAAGFTPTLSVDAAQVPEPADASAAAEAPTVDAPPDAASTGPTWRCPTGGGESATAVIGMAGGVLVLPNTVPSSGVDLRIEIPYGALTEDTKVTITALPDDPPAGFTARSPVYRFEPASLVLKRAAAIKMPHVSVLRLENRDTAVFWSNEGTKTFTPLFDSYSNAGFHSATITHFGLGFVGHPERPQVPPCTSVILPRQ